MAKKKSAPKADSQTKERTTVFLRPAMVRNVKYIAFMDEKTQTDVLDEALTEYVAKWEMKNGEIPKKG